MLNNPEVTSATADRERASDRLMIVVPGIGTDEPGETVNVLADALSETLHINETTPAGHLAARGSDEQLLTFFARQITRKAGNLRLVELRWADLSHVGPSVTGMLAGVFKLMFNLRHILTPLRRSKVKGVPLLATIAAIFFTLLRGPVIAAAALGYLMALVTVLYLSVINRFNGDSNAQLILDSHIWPALSVFAAVCATFAFFIRRRRNNGKLVTMSWFRVSFISLALFASAGFFLGSTQLQGSRSALIVLSAPVMTIWFMTMGVLLLLILASAVTTLSHPTGRQSISLFGVVPIVSLVFWFLLVPSIYALTYRAIPQNNIPDGLTKIVNNATPLLGWNWLGVIAGIAIIWVIIWNGRRWARNNNADTYDRHHNPFPRLIVSPWIVLTANGLMIVMGIVLLFDMIGTFPFRALTPGFNAIAFALIGAAAPLLMAVRGNVHEALDIALDITNYFTPDDVDVASDWNISQQRYELRDTVAERFRLLLGLCQRNWRGCDQLTIVAHSQGTEFVRAFLSDPGTQPILEQFQDVKVVTMGSPITHLYQYYFPGQFELPTRYVDNWLNLFRIDDFVGTHIEGLPNDRNIPLERGGHTGYFSDGVVAAEIVRFSLVDG